VTPGDRAERPGEPTPGAVPPTPTAAALRSPRVLLIGAIAVAVAVIVVLFFVGMRVGEGGLSQPVASPSATSTPSPTPTPTPTPTAAPGSAPPGPVAAGVHAWNDLGGGECLAGYGSPWAEEFTVVDCAASPNAQLVTTGVFAEDAAAPFPGEPELLSRLNLLCTVPTALDYDAASGITDLVWQGSYPADEAEWAAGDRRYYCFFTRSAGEPLPGSLAVAAAGSAG